MNGRMYSNFINSIRAEETRKKYDFCIKDFIKFAKTDKLLEIEVEKMVVDYILDLRKQKLSSNTVNTRTAAIYHFYTMNDVILNKVKINKYKGEFRKVVKDRAYTDKEIHKLLENADLRVKICILLMVSGGMRLGAIPSIKLKHLEYIKSNSTSTYKIIIYENTNQEYYTFVTPECSTLIDEYINHRRLNGEKVTSEAHLIREHFDVYSPKKARGISKHTIRFTIDKLLHKCDLDVNVSMTHGFRKFFTTQLINSRINPEIREMLLGHKIGLTGVYYKPTVEEMFDEYSKCINSLTINEENRLKVKLELEKSDIADMRRKIEDLQQQMVKKFG